MDKRVYLGLAIIGLILPYSQFLLFLIENGLDISMIINEITGYRLSAFAWLDIVVTAIVVILNILEEKGKIAQWWLPVAATLIVGPSCGLPLFMYLRE